MAFNYLGIPIGAAVAGVLAATSVPLAIVVLGLGGTIASALAGAFLVPRADPNAAEA